MGFYDLNAMDAVELSELYRRKVARGGSVTVARVEVKEGAVTLPHRHEGEELILVLEGAWRFRVGRQETTVRANQMLHIPAGVEHSSEALEDSVAIDFCSTARNDWVTGEDRWLHPDADDYLWAV